MNNSHHRYNYSNWKLPSIRRFSNYLAGYEGWAGFLKDYACCRDFSVSKNNLLTNCPYHDDEKASFALIDSPKKRTFYCFSCEATGSLKKLVNDIMGNPDAWKDRKKDLTRDYAKYHSDYDEYHQPFVIIDELLSAYRDPCTYWESRGLTEDTVRKYQLGASTYRYKLVFPVWDVVCERYVGLCTREWETHPEYPASRKQELLYDQLSRYSFEEYVRRSQAIFGANLLTHKDEVYVFEGAIDAMNHAQRTGLPSIATWGKNVSNAQVEYLSGFKHVILCPDKDEDKKGLKSAEKTEAQLMEKTTVSIALLTGPFKDYSEAVMAGVKVPNLKILPSRFDGRIHEIAKLYRVSQKQNRKSKKKGK